MDKCLSNGEIIYAFDIAKDYNQEKDIRNQSRCRKLTCGDPDCREPVIYRRGEIRSAHFAHLKSERSCVYTQYYSDMPDEIKKLKLSVYERLKSAGYDIAIDVRILQKHYTPIFIKLENGKKHAIEFSSKNISAIKLQELKRAYNDLGISVEWITVDSISGLVNENDAYYIKRFQLNESVNHTAIIYDKVAAGLAVISFDDNEYPNSGITDFVLRNNIFTFQFAIDGLIIKNGCLSAVGFQDEFDQWVDERKAYHEQKERELKERQKRIDVEEQARLANKKALNEQKQVSAAVYSKPAIQSKKKTDEPFCLSKITVPRTKEPLNNREFYPWDKIKFLQKLQLAIHDDETAIKMLISKVFECEDDELALFLSLYYDTQAAAPSPETKKYIDVCEHILKQAKKFSHPLVEPGYGPLI